MPRPWVKVIVNPVAGAYSTRRKWPTISRLLQHLGFAFDFQYTEGVGHAIELARTAASNGYSFLVAVGGDGTVNEVANGILHSPGANKTALGIISTGTGSDFIRSVGIPKDFPAACSTLTSPKRLVIDVGVVEYQSNGKRLRRFFVNAAGVGFDAAVVRETERLPKYFGGTVPYLAGVIRALIGYKNKPVVVRMEDETISGRVLNVVIANGGYVGGGMHIAPKAKVSDGLLDLAIVGDMGKFELLKELPTVYKGTHIHHPKFKMKKTTRATIKSPEQMLVYADGELLGESPASFWIMPRALRLVV